ncbi:MAG: ABC transporter permease [Planctomycetota bacterium]
MSDSQNITSSNQNSRIGKQIVLPLSKAFEIAWKSIRIRIWRSLITTSGIVLAIAFLMSVWTSGAFTDRLREIPEDHPSYFFTQTALQEEAGSGQQVKVRVGLIGDTQAVHDSEDTVVSLVRQSLQRSKTFSVLRLPDDPEALQEVLESESEEDQLDSLTLVGIPSSLATRRTAEQLRSFVKGGGSLILIGHDNLWPKDAPEEFVRIMKDLLPAERQSGTITVDASDTSPREHPAVANVEWDTQPEIVFGKTSPKPDATVLAEKKSNDQALLSMVETDSGLTYWLPVRSKSLTVRDSAGWLFNQGALQSGPKWGARDKLRGGATGKKDVWLVSLSLLVCIVGITNAMLMSVTERFREIGTMKCLGALDRFVVRLFLIESSFQGAVGSVIGAIIGFLLATLRSLFAYRVVDQKAGEVHWLAIQFFPTGTIMFWMLVSIVVGIILSIVAAIYPAYTAARMEPVDAMGVEA